MRTCARQLFELQALSELYNAINKYMDAFLSQSLQTSTKQVEVYIDFN